MNNTQRKNEPSPTNNDCVSDKTMNLTRYLRILKLVRCLREEYRLRIHENKRPGKTSQPVLEGVKGDCMRKSS